MTRLPIISPVFKHKNIRHGFYGRVMVGPNRGFSNGLYHSLNCGPGSDDVADHVARNRQMILDDLSPQAVGLCGLYQIHSNIVHYVNNLSIIPPQGDGLVTDRPRLALGILTADCVPILFADPEAGIIGAAHAGWKGAQADIIEQTIQIMCDKGARRDHIAAGSGPAINQENYEVGPEFLANFLACFAADGQFFKPAGRKDHYLFDLKGFIEDRLHKSGIRQYHICSADTYADANAFFSYRRSCHKRESDYGRQLSVIMLEQ